MLGAGGAVKILDFGIARLQRREAADAGDARAISSARPATWRRSSGSAGRPTSAPTSTRWASCCSRWSTGKRPFPEREPFSLARASLDRIARRLSTLVPEVSPGLDRLVSRLLASDPDLRPPRARVVADELRQLQAPRGAAVAADAVAGVGRPPRRYGDRAGWVGLWASRPASSPPTARRSSPCCRSRTPPATTPTTTLRPASPTAW